MTATTLLRPLGAGDLLDGAVWLYRKNFLRFVLMVALLRVPVSALLSLFQGGSQQEPLAFSSPNQLGLVLNHLLVATILSAVFAFAVNASVTAKPISVTHAYLYTGRRFVPLLVNAVLANLGYAAVLAVTSVGVQLIILGVLNPFTAFEESDPLTLAAGILVVCIYAALIALPLLYLDARWSVTQQAIALEGCSALSAFGRSATLMRGQYRRVMVFLLGLFLLENLLSTGPSFVSQAVAESFSPAYNRTSWTGLAYLLFGTAIPTAFDLLFLPISYIARALLYYDLRVRAEGLDLAVRIERWAEQPA